MQTREFHVYLYGPDRGPIPVSFEETADRLQTRLGLYFEPDGSFVWARAGGSEQVFGMLYDAAGEVQYCDMRGKCQRETWRELCSTIVDFQPLHELTLMRLPESVWQDLHSFETMTWPLGDQSSRRCEPDQS